MKRTRMIRQLVLIGAFGAVILLLIANRIGRHDTAGAGGVPQIVTTSTTAGAGDVPVITASNPTASNPTATSPSRTPTNKATTPADGDDGADDTAPVLVQPTDRPDVKQAATQFAAAWLNTYGQSPASWRQALLTRVTTDLGTDLADADPASVPSGAAVGLVTVGQQESLLSADADVLRTDTHAKLGVLRLTLVDQHGTWLISEIDWEPRR